jgi:hypothetical protein
MQEPGADPIYSCQATEEMDYTQGPPNTKTWYWRDVRCGNVTWWDAARALLVERFNAFQQSRGGTQYPPFEPSKPAGVSVPPPEALNLVPGELVRVRPPGEIERTLDKEGKYRGLLFDREMLKFCSGTYRVLRRVERIIDEPTGKMIRMKRDCIILDGVACESRYHGLCQRRIYAYWREAWLTRTNADRPSEGRGGEVPFPAFVISSALRLIWRRLTGGRDR